MSFPVSLRNATNLNPQSAASEFQHKIALTTATQADSLEQTPDVSKPFSATLQNVSYRNASVVNESQLSANESQWTTKSLQVGVAGSSSPTSITKLYGDLEVNKDDSSAVYSQMSKSNITIATTSNDASISVSSAGLKINDAKSATVDLLGNSSLQVVNNGYHVEIGKNESVAMSGPLGKYIIDSAGLTTEAAKGAIKLGGTDASYQGSISVLNGINSFNVDPNESKLKYGGNEFLITSSELNINSTASTVSLNSTNLSAINSSEKEEIVLNQSAGAGFTTSTINSEPATLQAKDGTVFMKGGRLNQSDVDCDNIVAVSQNGMQLKANYDAAVHLVSKSEGASVKFDLGKSGIELSNQTTKLEFDKEDGVSMKNLKETSFFQLDKSKMNIGSDQCQVSLQNVHGSLTLNDEEFSVEENNGVGLRIADRKMTVLAAQGRDPLLTVDQELTTVYKNMKVAQNLTVEGKLTVNQIATVVTEENQTTQHAFSLLSNDFASESEQAQSIENSNTATRDGWYDNASWLSGCFVIGRNTVAPEGPGSSGSTEAAKTDDCMWNLCVDYDSPQQLKGETGFNFARMTTSSVTTTVGYNAIDKKTGMPKSKDDYYFLDGAERDGGAGPATANIFKLAGSGENQFYLNDHVRMRWDPLSQCVLLEKLNEEGQVEAVNQMLSSNSAPAPLSHTTHQAV